MRPPPPYPPAVVTGQYPRAIFDFNVGVLRWSWRVGYYSYGALATDQYPPFTLSEVPDYPAHLSVDYPDHLSRGLVLVKWWLLAIPHYIVLSLFLGTGTWVAWQGDESQLIWGSGLVGILVLVAAVVLAFSGSYPRSVYDLLLGLNRWVLRVAAYVGLMTDRYPPFRLDMGPHEPSTALLLSGAPTPAPAGGAPTPTGAPPTALPGTTASSPARRAPSPATVTRTSSRTSGWTAPVAWNGLVADILGDVRVRVTPTGTDDDVFVGIARDRTSTRTSPESRGRPWSPRATASARCPDRAPSTPPEDAAIWELVSVGQGGQELVWTPRTGRWSMVVMNLEPGPASRWRPTQAPPCRG